MGCLLNTILFILLFGFIMALYVGTTIWTQVKQMRDMFRGAKNTNADNNRRRPQQNKAKQNPSNPPQKNKIFSKDQGEYVDFQEIP